MPIHGVDPLDSDNALLEYLSIASSIVRRINHYVKGPSDPQVAENAVLGDLVAMLALCHVRPSSGDAMAKAQVAEWRKIFLGWLESAEPKIPKRHLAGYKANAMALFDEIESFAVNKPKVLWNTKADHRG